MNKKVQAQIRKTLKTIPGYDPWRDAKAAGARLNYEKAAHVINWFPENLRFFEGDKAGQPFYLEKWQAAIVGNLFGWEVKNPKNKKEWIRRYSECMIYVARKNGKTPLAAGIAIYVMENDPEPAMQNVCTAADFEQAKKVYKHLSTMILENPDLAAQMEVRVDSVINGLSTFKVINAAADTKHGGNEHLIIIDELHAQPKRDLVDTLGTGRASRKQPLMIHLTTADLFGESICNEKLAYAKSVIKGNKDYSFLPVIYEVGVEENWKIKKTWKKANPNLGISVNEDYIKKECEKAQVTPGYEPTFRQLHLNTQMQQANRWLSMTKWKECGSTNDPITWRRNIIGFLKGFDCYAGLDLGSVSDLTSLVLVFNKAGKIVLLPYFWIPEAGIHRKSEKIKNLYLSWVENGFIKTTTGDVTDYTEMKADIIDIAGYFNIVETAVDKLFQGQGVCNDLMSEGLEVIEFQQNYVTYTAPMVSFEEHVIDGTFQHGNNPTLNWMAENVGIKHGMNNNTMPCKPGDNSLKIDGIAAALMGLARYNAAPVSTGSSYADISWAR